MAQKIYFGNVEVLNIKTRERRTLEKQLFKELDRPTDTSLRATVLRHINPKEREQWQITKLCFDTAKYMGDTVY